MSTFLPNAEACPENKSKKIVLTVTVCGILRPVDVAIVIDGQEPLCAAEQLPYAHVSSLHVVVVPGVSLVCRAVHDSGQLLRRAVTADHTHAAKQEDRMEVQSREQVLKVPCKHPFVHYNTMLWGSTSNMLKCEMCFCPSTERPAAPWLVTPPSLRPSSSSRDSCGDVETRMLRRDCGGAVWLEGGTQRGHEDTAEWWKQKMIRLFSPQWLRLSTDPSSLRHGPRTCITVLFRRCFFYSGDPTNTCLTLCGWREITVSRSHVSAANQCSKCWINPLIL